MARVLPLSHLPSSARRALALVPLLALAACPSSPPPDTDAAAEAASDAATLDAPATPEAGLPDGSPQDGAIPDAAAPDAARDASADARPLTGTLRDVQHVVIFIQENRSFDNYFGALNGVRGYGDPAALQLHTGANVFHQPNGTGELLPFHTSLQCVNDVDHGWDSGHAAWHGGLWDRWVSAKGPSALAGYSRADLPYYYALADAYTTLDASHCSVMGPTNPNRMYLMTGMIDPTGTGGGPVTGNAEPPAGYTWTTYPERLQSAGISWRVYQTLDNYDDNALAWFHNFINANPGEPLYERGMARATDVVRAFRQDVLNGTLPQVSWIIAPTQQSEHPPYPLAAGEALTQQLLQALSANPTVANSTVFFLTYDENGGFYDHTAPPTPPTGTAAEFVGGQPIGFGNRVPMIVISPWSRGGFVDSEVADHTSVLRFLELWTGVREPNISAWRRQVAGDLTAAFDFAHPDFTTPMLATRSPLSCSGSNPTPPTMQALPTQERGTRPARALPYQPNATGRTDCAAGRYYIAMSNAGTAALHFRIGANQFRSDGPWEYDLAPGGMQEDYFSVVSFGAGRYDLTALGPNGFERQFVGNVNTACGALEVNSVLHADTGNIELTYVNRGSVSVTFTTTATRYRTDGPWMTTVAAGGMQSQQWDVAAMGQGWYSLDVTASTDTAFRRRFAGHLENGRASVTGL